MTEEVNGASVNCPRCGRPFASTFEWMQTRCCAETEHITVDEMEQRRKRIAERCEKAEAE